LQLIHENQPDLSSTKTTAQTTPSEAINLTEGEPIGTASEQNDEPIASSKLYYKYPYYFQITELSSEETADRIIHSVIYTTKGTFYFNVLSMTPLQNGIFRGLKLGDCIYLTTDNKPIEKLDGKSSFEEYISTPEPISCDSIQ